MSTGTFVFDGDETPHNPFHNRYQILALSGGGYRGLFTAKVLEMLEQDSRPLRESFELITGTSIGSILAGALSVGISAQTCVKGMIEHGPKIFPRGGPVRRTLRGTKKLFFRASYKTGPLEAAIRTILGDAADQALSEIDQALVIPCVSHTRARLKLLRSKGLAGSDADDTSLLDAMLASAAAPTYFPARKIGTEVVIDGGLVANGPSLVGISESVNWKQTPLDDIHVLAVGTASPSIARKSGKAGSPGVLGWMLSRQLFETTMQAQETLAAEQCRMLIHDRFVELNVEPSAEQGRVVGLDRAGKVSTDTLLDLAGSADQSQSTSDARRAFID